MEWQARDPNGDALAYQVDLRQVGNKRWIRIGKDVRKNSYTFDSNTVPDGRYEVRVTASDSPDNPPAIALSKARISEPFTVDNTPPRIEDLRFSPTGQNTFRIQARLVDDDRQHHRGPVCPGLGGDVGVPVADRRHLRQPRRDPGLPGRPAYPGRAHPDASGGGLLRQYGACVADLDGRVASGYPM